MAVSEEVRETVNPAVPTILATEHWSLLGTRAMVWNEAMSRASVFLTVLSAAVVALALVADATDFGGPFVIFALVLLPAVLFLGLATFARLVHINAQDNYLMLAMNRLRRGYLDLAPQLEPYFTTSPFDDKTGLFASLNIGQPAPLPLWTSIIVDTPTIVSTINALLAAATSALAAHRLGTSNAWTVAAGAIAFVTVWLALFAIQLVVFVRSLRTCIPRFPTPPPEDGS
jgi:hypothetical protein